jgi:DNA-directed RNA polymerase specialized sigma24 family protein
LSGARPQFDERYRTLREPVGHLCLHLTGDRAAAEGAVQETFLAVFRSLPAFRCPRLTPSEDQPVIEGR